MYFTAVFLVWRIYYSLYSKVIIFKPRIEDTNSVFSIAVFLVFHSSIPCIPQQYSFYLQNTEYSLYSIAVFLLSTEHIVFLVFHSSIPIIYRTHSIPCIPKQYSLYSTDHIVFQEHCIPCILQIMEFQLFCTDT